MKNELKQLIEGWAGKEGCELQSALRDVLTDLRHVAVSLKLNFNDAVEGSLEVFEEENEFIAHDWCGWASQYGRYTHCPSGDTLVCRAGWGQQEWDQAQLEFLEKYPGLNVHECPRAYRTDDPLIGTTDEICVRLRERLG